RAQGADHLASSGDVKAGWTGEAPNRGDNALVPARLRRAAYEKPGDPRGQNREGRNSRRRGRVGTGGAEELPGRRAAELNSGSAQETPGSTQVASAKARRESHLYRSGNQRNSETPQ